MFIHLEIFFCIITLLLGSWVVYYSMQLYRKTSQTFLKPIVIFILFYNLSIFMRLVSKYMCANILASCFVFDASIYGKALAPFAFAINIGMTVSMGAAAMTLLGKKLPPRGKPWIVFIVGLIVLGYGMLIFLSSQLDLMPWLPLFNRYIYPAVALVAYAFLFYLLIGARRIQDRDRARMIRAFAIFYLVAYTSLILSFVFPLDLQYLFVVVVHILFNLFPIFWLRYSFFPYHRHTISAIADKGALEHFYDEHSISKREKEIVELILVGKSNREIEHQLFISPHTVKNHIYSIYQKTGVSSRSQLIHLILRSKNYHD